MWSLYDIFLVAAIIGLVVSIIIITVPFFKKWRFKHKVKSFMIDNQYKITEAFRLDGVTYYQFDDQFKLPTGRGLCALTIYEEFNMRCTREYLELHTRAMEKLFSDPKKINIQAMVIINKNLQERLNLAMFPDHIYKLASVVFFDKTESYYNYDYAYNQKKIEKWKAAGGTLDFFLKTPLRDLIPSLKLPEENAQDYFQVATQVDQMHQQDLQEVLSKNG
jgi:hypothetical protein